MVECLIGRERVGKSSLLKIQKAGSLSTVKGQEKGLDGTKSMCIWKECLMYWAQLNSCYVIHSKRTLILHRAVIVGTLKIYVYNL